MGGADQAGLHVHAPALQVLAHCGDLVAGQVRRVVLMQLQELLQLTAGLAADTLQGKRSSAEHADCTRAAEHAGNCIHTRRLHQSGL